MLEQSRLGGSSALRGVCALACLLACSLAQANIVVEIKGVSGELERNVRTFLSLERYKSRERLQDDVVERLQERAEPEVKNALRPFGYYEPKVTSKLEKLENGRDWRVRIDIDPGAPVLMDVVSVKLSGPGAQDPVFARMTHNFPLRTGQRLSHAAYEEIKGGLQRTAATYGYLDAKLLRNELRVDPPHHKADAYLELETGLRYRFGPTHFQQNVINEALMRRFVRYHEGDPYDATELLRTQFALDDSQYFSSVDVLPEPRDAQNRVVPVSISGQANRRNRYQLGIGYGTDTRARGTVSWEDRIVNRAGHRFRIDLQAAAQQSTLQSRYIIPLGDPALEKLTFGLTKTREQLQALDISDVTFEPSVTEVMGRWQRVLFVDFADTITSTPNGLQHDKLLMPGISYSAVPQGYLGEGLLTRTFYAELRGSPDSHFLQLRMQGERLFDIAPGWHFLTRGELGTSLAARTSSLPGTQRFFAGGDRSVRGFAFDSLSPSELLLVNGQPVPDPKTGVLETIKTGGRQLLVGSAEVVRDLPRNFAVATFFDIGRVFNHLGENLDYAHGFGYAVGVGVRYRTPVVTIGVDIAEPISTSQGPRLHLNFSPKF
ncbi:MAG TPA: BamA/TamA family outer membrane protein [Steroidobacteraceae bacterium]